VTGYGNGAGRPTALRHRALLYRAADELDAAATSFAAEGLGSGEGVVVALPDDVAERVRHGLGPSAEDVAFLDTAAVYTRPGWALACYQREVEDRTAGGRPLRVISQPDRRGSPSPEADAWASIDAAVNASFASAPLTLLCPYDVSDLDPAVLADARRTHPELVDGGTPRTSPHYTDPALFCTRHRSAPLAPLPPPIDQLAFTAPTLSSLRRLVRGHGERAGLAPERVTELVLAVNEAATNSIRHAGGSGLLRITRTPGEVLCDVIDAGVITAPLAGLVPPAGAGDGSYGLWMIHQLCDLVEIRSGSTGTTVRLHVTCP